MRSIVFPLAVIGGTAKLGDVKARLKKLDGIEGAAPFFNATALRVYYNPDRASVKEIFVALIVEPRCMQR